MGYDYDLTHEKIISSAKEHFMEKGFSNASIRQICQAAGVTNGAFYAHFDSKEDLFASIVEPVVDGMQDLYDEENVFYMDIKSADDVKKSLEQTFTSNKKMIRYLYEHADIFKLILTAGNGTAYEGFVDSLSREEAHNTMEFFKKCSNYVSNTDMLSEALIVHMSKFIVSSVFDGLLEGKTEEEAVHETELATQFCLAGIRYFLGI